MSKIGNNHFFNFNCKLCASEKTQKVVNQKEK